MRRLLLLALLCANPVSAQQYGDFVRVSGEVKSEYIRADSAGIYLASGFIPFSDITSFELGEYKGSAWAGGMLLGGLVGGVSGNLVARLSPCDDRLRGGFITECSGKQLGATVLGAVGGLVFGAAVGSGIKKYEFTPIAIPTGHGLEIGLNMRMPRLGDVGG